jgi:3-oxoacyl-[acyl-carrier protein] reductase
MTLDDEIALVTGASRGIGRAIALELGRQGAKVIGTATSREGAERITATLLAAGVDGRGEVLDVTDAEGVTALAKHIGATDGPPSILVNNAGITRDSLLMRMSDDDWNTLVDTDLGSVYRLCRAYLRAMVKARRGRIINISSVVAEIGNPGQTNYAAAKAGMLGFTRALAREVAARGITVNAVAPGFIETDLTHALDGPQQKALLQMIPAARLGRPEDVAAAVVFLASPQAAYITGVTLHVNGGMYMG